MMSKFIEVKKEPELRPKFIQKIRQIQRQKSFRVKDFFKRYMLK